MPRGNDRRGVWACLRERRRRRRHDHRFESRHARHCQQHGQRLRELDRPRRRGLPVGDLPRQPARPGPAPLEHRLRRRPDLDRPLHDRRRHLRQRQHLRRRRPCRRAREERAGRLGRRADQPAQLQRWLQWRVAASSVHRQRDDPDQRRQPDRIPVPGWQLLGRERRHEQRSGATGRRRRRRRSSTSRTT